MKGEQHGDACLRNKRMVCRWNVGDIEGNRVFVHEFNFEVSIKIGKFPTLNIYSSYQYQSTLPSYMRTSFEGIYIFILLLMTKG